MSLTAPGPSASVVARAESSPLPCATVGSRRADDFPSSQRSRVRSARPQIRETVNWVGVGQERGSGQQAGTDMSIIGVLHAL